MSARQEFIRGVPADQRALGAIEPEDLSTNQEGSFPWFVGEEIVSTLWVGVIFKQVTVEEDLDTGK